MSRTTQSNAQSGADSRLGIPNNLPHDLSSFIGRDRELARLASLLHQTRLLTLIGPGGAGKTRLAQQLADDVLQGFPEGVWLVELAALRDPPLVSHAVALSLGAHDAPGRSPSQVVVDAIGRGRVLLILDNCEHLVDACAELVETLLRACPQLRVLATSREPLALTGELTWPVPPLGLPASTEALLEADAVQLFFERARAVRPDLVVSEHSAAVIAHICRRLDGMPLAIELAAARVRTLSLSDIADRLDDRFGFLVTGSRTAPTRQQTLRGALDWSYDLLSDDERSLLADLAVFVAGFDANGLRAVCGPESEDLVWRLVDRSLLVAEPDETTGRTRYHLLETVRAYAWERLAEQGRRELLRQRHSEWILEQGRLAEAAFHGPEQGYWLRWAEREHDNVRAALAWLVERGDAEAALQLVQSWWWSWSVHMRWSESLSLFERVLSMPGAERPTPLRAAVLTAAGTVGSMLGDLTAARARLDEAHAIGMELGDEWIQMLARGPAQIAQQFQGDVAGAMATAQALMAWAREVGFRWGEVRCLEGLASVAASQGDYARAAELLEEAARISRTEDDAWSLARCLDALGDVERSRGDHARAAVLYSESQVQSAAVGLGPLPGIIHNLGYVALAGGDRARARECFGEALALFRRIGDRRGASECVIGLGCVLAASGDGLGAARLFGAGHAALAAMHSQLWVSNRRDYERWLAAARARLSSASFDEAWAEGACSSLDEAMTLASRPGFVRSGELLTTREREVARLVARGLSNREVAETLVITEKTAANHLQRVLEKLDIHSRSQLAARASELGLT